MWRLLRRPPRVGLDIGSTAVRIVALDSRHGWELAAVAEAALPGRPAASADDVTGVSQAVRSLVDAPPFRGQPVNAALRANEVAIMPLQLPNGSRRAVENALRSAAEDDLSLSLSETYLAWTARRTRPGGEVQVLGVAAPRGAVATRLEMARQAGVRLRVLDVDVLALAKAYRVNYADQLAGPVIIAHLGRATCTVAVLDGGVLVGAKTIQVAESAAGLVARALARAIDGFGASPDQGIVTRVLLSGGKSRIPELAQHLSAEAGVEVEMFDPVRRIRPPAEGVGTDGLGPEYAIAIGLALWERAA
jgi:type IV pilus assembly protein PilM